MSNLILVMGESGNGKTTSLRTLDPETTFVIDADKKGLSWRNWRQQYSPQSKNYIVTDDPSSALSYLKVINDNPKYQKYKVVVVDTINGLMVAQEGRDRSKKGYDKWNDLAWYVLDLVDYALTMRDDLTVIFTAHAQTERDDSGVVSTRVKTSGRKLDKIVLESKFTTVLHAKNEDGEFVFETRSPTSTAKAPMDCFPETIPNDMRMVVDALREYEGMEPIPQPSNEADEATEKKE